MNRKIRSVISYLLAAALLFGLSGAAFAVRVSDADAAARKIVVFREGFSDRAAMARTVTGAGAARIKDLPSINAVVVMIGPAAEKALLKNPHVLRIDTDTVVSIQKKPVKPTPTPLPTAAPTPTPPPVVTEQLPWGVDRIDADLVWDADADLVADPGSNTGEGVKVAVVDTGIDLDHPDLAANIKGGYNAITSLKTADDDNGHGTHVAGIIAGVDNDIGILGVAPKASLYAVKVLNRKGSGYISDIIEGLQWCIDNEIQVVNMSFGASADDPNLHAMIIKAYDSGIVLVASAGNSGPGDDTVMYPGKYREVIAVSATDSGDGITSWSSRGPEVCIAAPGDSILSTYKGGAYAIMSGTSMAAPHVTGTAALVVASGVSGPAAVRNVLVSTADDLGAAGFDELFGYGLLDAQQAATGVQTLP